MNVLSLFDGISGARIALDNLGVRCTYFASEIDPYAESISKYHYPDTIRLGDITKIKGKDLPKIDLIIGGSPCQGFSVAGHRKAFKDPRSKLFFEFSRLLKECKPKYFLLENVRMKKEWIDIISNEVRAEPIMINSALVTAQNRNRLYWANFPIGQPEDRKIVLKDIIEEGITDRDKSYCIDASYFKGGNLQMYFNKNKRQLIFGDWCTEKEKSYAITATYGNAGNLNDYFEKHKRQLVFKPINLHRIKHGFIDEKDMADVDKYPSLCAQSPASKYKISYPISLTEVRTEEAKEIRRKNRESGIDTCPRRAKALVPRTDDKANCLTANLSKEHLILDKPLRIGDIGKGAQGQRIYSEHGKSVTLNAVGGGLGAKTGLYAIAQRGRYNEEGKIKQQYEISGTDKSNAVTTVQKDSMLLENDGELLLVRKLTPIECERLQGIKDNWTQWGINDKGKKVKISNTQRYKAVGNGFTIPVIEHILKEIT